MPSKQDYCGCRAHVHGVVKVPGTPPCDKTAATGSETSREVVAVREGEFLDILGVVLQVE